MVYESISYTFKVTPLTGVLILQVLTGVGGSGEWMSSRLRSDLQHNLSIANTRSDDVHRLGIALLQHVTTGILPTGAKSDIAPLASVSEATTMPEAWVIGGIMLRMNSMVRGHSGVRWEVIAKLQEILDANIVPVVPLRGSLSASGDLLPLAHIAGTICGDPTIDVYFGPKEKRCVLSSNEALARAGITPLVLAGLSL